MTKEQKKAYKIAAEKDKEKAKRIKKVIHRAKLDYNGLARDYDNTVIGALLSIGGISLAIHHFNPFNIVPLDSFITILTSSILGYGLTFVVVSYFREEFYCPSPKYFSKEIIDLLNSHSITNKFELTDAILAYSLFKKYEFIYGKESDIKRFEKYLAVNGKYFKKRWEEYVNNGYSLKPIKKSVSKKEYKMLESFVKQNKPHLKGEKPLKDYLFDADTIDYQISTYFANHYKLPTQNINTISPTSYTPQKKSKNIEYYELVEDDNLYDLGKTDFMR